MSDQLINLNDEECFDARRAVYIVAPNMDITEFAQGRALWITCLGNYIMESVGASGYPEYQRVTAEEAAIWLSLYAGIGNPDALRRDHDVSNVPTEALRELSVELAKRRPGSREEI